jgi:hypothetical protein
MVVDVKQFGILCGSVISSVRLIWVGHVAHVRMRNM